MSTAESQRETHRGGENHVSFRKWGSACVCTHEIKLRIENENCHSRYILQDTSLMLQLRWFLSPPSKSAFSAQWNIKSRNRHVDFFFNSWFFLFEDLCQNKSRVIEWKGFSSLLTTIQTYCVYICVEFYYNFFYDLAFFW